MPKVVDAFESSEGFVNCLEQVVIVAIKQISKLLFFLSFQIVLKLYKWTATPTISCSITFRNTRHSYY